MGEFMHALFIILNKTEYLDDVLAKFVELQIEGATIIDSQGMASAIVHGSIDNIPIFGSLKSLLGGSNPYNKTIFTVIDGEEETLRVVMDEIRQLLKSTNETPIGFMFTVPVDHIVRLDNQN